MSRKNARHTTEQIVNKLRQADVELSKGQTIATVSNTRFGGTRKGEALRTGAATRSFAARLCHLHPHRRLFTIPNK
jgi:hypothetical protein